MTDTDIKTLSERATQGKWRNSVVMYGWLSADISTPIGDGITSLIGSEPTDPERIFFVNRADPEFICALVNAYRSGHLVPSERVAELEARIREIEEVASNSVSADHYSAEDALSDIQAIRRLCLSTLRLCLSTLRNGEGS